jgi:hypothetical protein
VRFGPTTRLSHEQVIEYYTDFWTVAGFEEQIMRQIDASPKIAMYEVHRFFEDVLTHMMIRSAFTNLPVPTQANHSFVPDQVPHAVDPVLQSIDQDQVNLHQRPSNWDSDFADGFALAAEYQATAARAIGSTPSNNEHSHISRPRRCWLQPMKISNKEIHEWYVSRPRRIQMAA